MPNKTITIYGVDIRIKDKYTEPRKKATTNLSLDNYNYLKEINTKTKIKMSVLYDNLIYLIRENPEILKKYINMLENY